MGDDFNLNFTITNNTGRDLTFHHSGPPVIFRLETDDSLVASSTDGLVWAAVILEGTLAHGESYSTTWRAPNTPWSGKHIIPRPGQYRATVRAGCFFCQRAQGGSDTLTDSTPLSTGHQWTYCQYIDTC